MIKDQVIQMETELVKIFSMDYNEKEETLEVEVPIPLAKKETIDVEVYADWFVIRAMRTDKEDANYLGTFNLCCPVDGENVKGTFEDGLLKLSFPLDDGTMRPKQVTIT
jgi:HSP20 family molecular chaperone IbpA